MTLTRRALLAAAPWAALPAGPRVVPLDWSLVQTLLALGVAPLAVPDPAEYRLWVVEPPLPSGTGDVGGYVQPNLEALAALRPGLIATMQLQDGVLPQLRRIAPVLRLPLFTAERAPLRLAEAAARALGAATGRAAAAEALVADAAARMAAGRRALAGRAVPPVLPASLLDGTRLRVFGAGSLCGDVLVRLGLRPAWEGGTDEWGAASVGPEALAGLGPVLLALIGPVPPGLEAVLSGSALWRALPSVRAGRVLRLPPVATYGGLPAATRFAALLGSRLCGGGACGDGPGGDGTREGGGG